MTDTSELPGPPETKAGMELFHRSHDGLLHHLAGPLYPMAAMVFEDRFTPIYLLSHPHRRQVWNAVLAVTGPDADQEQLRTRLLNDGARSLLKQAYTTVPRGFVMVLGRLGDIGFAPEAYSFWHAYLLEHPEDAPIIRSMPSISGALTDAMRQLPRPLARLLLKRRGADPEPLLRLAELVNWVHLRKPDPSIWDDLAARLEQGEAPKSIVEKIADALPCPPGHITGDPRFRHFSTIRQLRQEGQNYRNCIGWRFCLEGAVTGRDQYYEHEHTTGKFVVAIALDPPFGYRLKEIGGYRKDQAPPDVAAEIEAALAEHGIYKRETVYHMFWQWGVPTYPVGPIEELGF